MDYSKEETEERMKAALRGARTAGPQHRQGPAPSDDKSVPPHEDHGSPIDPKQINQ